METSSGCGTYFVAAAMVIGIWLWVGNGWTSVRGWLGQDVYEDQRSQLDAFVKKGKIGTSGDVWLVKLNLGVEDRVALFFGYMDDWTTCYEFAGMYMQMYPADTYSCRLAN